MLATLAVWLAAGLCQAQMTSLVVIPTTAPSGMSLPAGVPARVMLTASDAAALGGFLGIKVAAGSTTFEYVIDRYPQLESVASRTWLEPTFLIDFDEPVFATLKTEMKDLGEHPGRIALVDFVARIVDDKEPRGWDLASVVATRRQGDCTEHAVLTTALARMYGIPARVAVGIALISDGTSHAAFGHAWSEMREGDHWVVADAALQGFGKTVRYVPMGIVEEEGLGYTLAIASLTRRWIQRVDILGPVPTK